MKWTIEKPRPPKGQCYILKTSSLQEMLITAGVETAVHLLYQYSSKALSEIILLDCHYWLPNANMHHSRFYIRTSAVNFEDKKIADDLMQLRILPELIDWMQKIFTKPEDSTSIRHDMLFRAAFGNGEIKITHK